MKFFRELYNMLVDEQKEGTYLRNGISICVSGCIRCLHTYVTVMYTLF